MGMIGSDEVNRRMGYHPATVQTIPLYEDSRARAVSLACHWDETLPPGRELALALTALQEALMWANAAVACNLAPLEDPTGRQPNALVQQMAHNRPEQELTVALRVPDGLTPEQVADQVRGEVLARIDRSAAERSILRVKDVPQA